MAEKENPFTADIIEFFNSEFAGDISKLNSAEIVLHKLEITGREIKSEPGTPNIRVSEIEQFTKRAENALAKIAKLQKKQQSLQDQSVKQIAGTKVQRDHFRERLKAVKELENAHNYLLWLHVIELTNDSMEEAISQGPASETVAHFSYFKKIWDTLKNSECQHFIKYLEDILQYWFDILKEKYGTEFQKLLPHLQWPVIPTNMASSTNDSSDTVKRFKELFITLYEIQLPNNFRKTSHEKIENGHGPFILPFQLMFEPLQKRFLFHFIGKKQTNKVEKPEWYLAQILTWISDHALFLSEVVQPILEKQKLKSVFATEEFMRCLVQLAITRLQKDLPVLLADDHLLSHTVDEIFLFEKELQNQGYPKFYPCLLEVLTTEPCFTHWKSLEHKSALEKMDSFLNVETAWKSRYQDEEEELDELHVPECGEMFITLLLSITERYRLLSDEKLQLSFLELQLELLDDFRLRMHQLSQYQVEETLNPRYSAIINTINYVVMVLNEWSNFPLYLKLYAALKTRKMNSAFPVKMGNSLPTIDEADELDGSVFDAAIVLLEHMQKDLLQTLCERVMMDIKAKSRSFRKEKWFCMPTVHDKKALELSASAYPLLDIINSSLQQLQELLAKPLFTTVWQRIARELDLFLYEEVILQNSFNDGGAQQLHFDMIRNLFAIFGRYTLKPETYFRLVKESCTLLTLLPAPAMLLKESLMQQEKFKDRSSTLAELGVNNLTPSQALVILQQRNDIIT